MFIHRAKFGGESYRNALTWRSDTTSKVVLMLNIGMFYWYFRWRSFDVRGKRFIFSFDVRGSSYFDFDTRSIVVCGERWSMEIFEDLTPDELSEILHNRNEYQLATMRYNEVLARLKSLGLSL